MAERERPVGGDRATVGRWSGDDRAMTGQRSGAPDYRVMEQFSVAYRAMLDGRAVNDDRSF
jgi:hypothetical protein